MVSCLSYVNSMSDVVKKIYKILGHTITFNIIVFDQQKLKNAAAASGCHISSHLLAQASVKSVGQVQIINHSPV